MEMGQEGGHGAVPGQEERLVELVEDVDDEVVVGDRLDLRPRELVVDQDPLQHFQAIRHCFSDRAPQAPNRPALANGQPKPQRRVADNRTCCLTPSG